MLCAALIILETFVTAASIDLSTFRSDIDLASDARTSVSSLFRSRRIHLDRLTVEAEEVAIAALITAFPRLQTLSGTFHAFRNFHVTA